MRSILKLIAGFLGLILLLALLAVVWLANSNGGLRWMLAQADPVLSVDTVKGDLSSFEFSGLQFSSDATQVTIARGAAQLDLSSLFGLALSVERLELSNVQVDLPASEEPEPPASPWAGIELPIDVYLQQASIENLRVSQQQASLLSLDRIKLSGAVENSQLQLSQLMLEQAENRVSIEGRVDLTADPAGEVELRHSAQWHSEQHQLSIDGTLGGIWQALQIEQTLVLDQAMSESIDARLSGDVNDLLSERLRWNIGLTTEPVNNFQLAEQSLSLNQGNFQFSGDFQSAQGLAGLNARLQTQISGGNAEFSEWHFRSNVQLQDDVLQVNEFQLRQAAEERSAALTVSGQVDALTSFISNSEQLGQVDLQGSWQDLTWPLTGGAEQLRANGSFTVEGDSARYAVNANAQGESFSKPLSAEAQFIIRGQTLEIDTLKVRSAKSTLQAEGSFGENYDLSWNLQSPELGDFLPSANGPLFSRGTLSGTRDQPKLNVQASSAALSYANYQVQQLNLNGVLDGVANTGQIDLALSTGALRINNQLLATNTAFNASGSLGQHTLRLNADLASRGQLQVRVDGALQRSQSNALLESDWQATLRTLDISDPRLGRWSLDDPLQFALAKDSLSASQGCLVNGQQALCVQANLGQQEMLLEATMQALDLANLNRLTSLYDISVSGQADGDLKYQKQAGQASGVLQAQLQSRDSKLTWQDSIDGELSEEVLPIDRLSINVTQQQTLQATANIELQGDDKLSAELNVDAPIEAADFMQAEARANANLRIDDLSILPAVLLEAVSLNGSLRAQGELNGSLASPKIIASAALDNAQADIPELGLKLQDLQFDVNSSGTSKVTLNGSLRSGEGTLNLDGDVDFIDITAPAVNLQLSGQQITLANTSELDIVGDIQLNAKLSQKLLDLRGDLKFQKALIDFKLPDTAVSVSNDVVLQGDQQEQSRTQQKLRLNVDLGDSTRIKAKGLDAKLLGQILIFQNPGGILRADGEIRVNDGRYRAYGQDLKIDQGSLIFSGGSVDDPSLSLTAEKTVDSITAGVSVTGRASSPRLELYSSPSMPDEDILSVLVFGKRVGSLESQDGLTLLRIANSLRGDGTSNITKITEGLQQSLGLTSLELQLSGDTPSIVAGKQLSTRFYVGYGYGLLDAAQSLILRYKLNDAWSIKADVGADSGADLRYQIDR